MTPEYAEVVTVWIRKAKSDLAAARVLIIRDTPLLDTGVYHC